MAKRILFLLAHPDDETFGPGGTIAKYAREGHQVHLLAATRGEAGMLGDPPVTDREHLGEVRSAELEAAAAVLGAAQVHHLGFSDGKLAETPMELLVEGAVELVRAGDPGWYPGHFRGGDLRPWVPWKLYQFEVPREVLEAWGIPLSGVPLAKLTTIIDTSADAETKLRAFQCHRTQKKDVDRILARPGFREFLRQETYVLARTWLPGPAFPETDLLAGIPED
jgi:LmbE family N-acetylglucosaminyl deacetylase